MSTKPSITDDEDAVVAIARRKAVLSVMTDASLSAVERNAKILDIIDVENYRHRSVPLPRMMMANGGVNGKGTSTTSAPGGGVHGSTFSSGGSEDPRATSMEGGDDCRKPATTNASTASPAASDNFEERLAAKMKKSATTGNNSSTPAASDSFEEKIAAKMNGDDSYRGSATANTTAAPAASGSFEERIAAKMDENNRVTSASSIVSTRSTGSANIASAPNFEVRPVVKMKGADNDSDFPVQTCGPSGVVAMLRDMPGEDDVALAKRRAVQSFTRDGSLSAVERNERIRDIMSGKAVAPKVTSPTYAGGDVFEDRIAAKLKGGDIESIIHSAPSVDAGGPAGGEAMLRDKPDEDDIALAKRAAVRSVMKDLTLSSKERQERIRNIMSSEAMLPMTAAPTWSGGDSFDEKIAAMTKGGDTNAASSVVRDCTEEQTAVDIKEGDPNAALLVNRRDCVVAQHTAEKKESDMNRLMGDVPNLSSSSRWRREDIDAKIARKLSRMRSPDDTGSDDDDDDIRSGGDDDDVFGSFPLSEDHVSYNYNSDRNDHDDDDSVGDGGFVGVGSLPLPEEHFVDVTEYPQQQHPDDINLGLAVATAIDPDEEEAYIYNAVEYDPDAKPPLHKNRRFRVYSYLALLLITISVVLVVIFVTAASQSDEIIEENYYPPPSISPTQSPITDRMTSGIMEQLEAGVLRRSETFASIMNEENGNKDPRVLALDWILHIDDTQLVSDDIDLYQRYALAVLAYTLDSRAWFHCGDPGENYTEISCLVLNGNSTKEFGSWLSSTSECTWFGVTCSDDGVVRGVDLNDNGLIGTLPHELNALPFLQLLHLPYNCIYGTIPPEIGELRHLLSLELHGNGLSGVLPDEIYDIEDLQLLNLAAQWGEYRQCNTSDGTHVNINYRMGGTMVPFEENAGLAGNLGPKLGMWRSMKGLYLNKNSFFGVIPEEIGNLRYLRFLWLEDNFLEGSIPNTITALRNLQQLKLGDNFLISSLPSEVGKLMDMEILEVHRNSMYGEIPSELYNMTKLEILRLDDTLMKKSPWLVTNDEGFTGSISTTIGNLQELRGLLLNNNPLSGTVPTELGLCEKLEMLRIHGTNIEGTMPMEICTLRDKSLNSDEAGILYADCRPNNRTGEPFLVCDCCTDCCDHTTRVCIADD